MSNKKYLNVTLDLPYIGVINGEWAPSEIEKMASWELYVILITHTSFLKSRPEDILIRESVMGLRSIFICLQVILIKYGLSIHKPKEKKQLSFGYIIILILNHALRPFVEKWFSVLLIHANNNPEAVFDYKTHKIICELNDLHKILNDLIYLLAKIVKIPSVLTFF